MRQGQGQLAGADVAVLVLAPVARDTTAVCEFLASAGIDTIPCADIDELCGTLLARPQPVLITEEALTGEASLRLASTLAVQPSWSDVPVLLLANARGGPQPDRQALDLMQTLGNVTLITRPVHPVTLLSAVHAAVRVCRHQQALRDAVKAPPAQAAPLADPYRRLIEESPVATMVQTEGRIVYANAVAAALLAAADSAALLDHPIQRWIHPDFVPAMDQALAAASAGAGPASMAQIWVRADRAAIDVAVVVAAVAYRERAAVQILALDLAEFKGAERALRKSEARFRAALKNAPIALSEQDRDLRYTWVYDALFARPSAELIGRCDVDLLPQRAEAEALEAFKRDVLESGIGARRRFRLTLDGGPHEYDIMVEPLQDQRGDITGITALVLRVDEYVALQERLRRQAEQLARMDQRKNDFIAQLAHELRNPLAPIHNAVHVLKIQPDPPDPVHLKWAIEVIGRQVTQLARLVDDLLDVARITHGGIKLRKEPLELGQALVQAVEVARPLTTARKQVVTYSPPIEPLRVLADPTRLMQIVGNLMSNSARYTPAGGHISLTVRREGSDAVIVVKDDGMGIAPEVLPHLFEPFYRGVRGANQVGLGLGLALVEQLAKLHDGSVQAHSEGLDEGSEFVVRLPLLQEAPAPVEVPAVRPLPVIGWRILIVDDDRDVAQSFALLLGLMGHEVKSAPDGATALAIAASFHPQVVFVDIGLPDMDGYELARALRAADPRPDLRLVALTGYGQEEVRERAVASGFDAHLLKPATADTLEQLLASFGAPR